MEQPKTKANPNGSQELLGSLGIWHRFWLLHDSRYLPISGSRWGFWKELVLLLGKLRWQKYDLAVWPYAQTTLKKQIFAWVMGAKQTLLHKAATWLLPYLPKSILSVPFRIEDHVIERNTQLLKSDGISTDRLEIRLQLAESSREWG